MAVVHVLPLEKRAVGADPLLGRDEECELIERALDALSQGAARLVEISGEPGIGKTRMLAQLGDSARRRGYPVLAGRTAVPSCDRPAGAALGALGEALDDHLRGLAPQRLADLSREHRARLATLFPSFPAPVPISGTGPEQERSTPAAFLAIRALLEAVTSTSPIVITLDDVHWADEDTTAVLALLLARPPEAPVLLAVAHRPRQAPVALRSAFDEAHALTRLALAPLSEPHSAALAGLESGSASAAMFHRESGGNPLYLKALLSTARPRSDRIELGAIPLALETKLAVELGALTAPGRLVASAASVLTEAVEPSLLAEVAELPESAVYPAIGEVVKQDLLRSIAGTGCFAFRHAVARAAIYQGTDSAWRLAAHARAARALQLRRAPVAVRVPHLVRLAAPGDVEVMAALVDAASAIWERSATAAQWLRSALQLLPADTDAAARGLLLLELGLALGAEERPGTEGGAEGGRDALEQALADLATEREIPEDTRPKAPTEQPSRDVRYLTTRAPWGKPRRGESATLTQREQQVATLVCEGLTNRQIASRLFVTDKTVEMHLSKVFAKLNVANRVGVVRAFQHVAQAA
jgi:predicted ATPase/DNA-binding CsgD family transcriptional regulator